MLYIKKNSVSYMNYTGGDYVLTNVESKPTPLVPIITLDL